TRPLTHVAAPAPLDFPQVVAPDVKSDWRTSVLVLQFVLRLGGQDLLLARRAFVTAPDADPALHRVRQRPSSNLLRMVRANASHCSSWRGLHSTTEAEPSRLAWVTMTQAEVGAALGDEGG